MLTASRLFSFSNTTLSKGEDRSVTQMSVRNASIAVIDRVRYAKNIQLLTDAEIPSNPMADDGFKYIIFDNTDNTLRIIDIDGTSTVKKEKKFLNSKLNTDTEKTHFKWYKVTNSDGTDGEEQIIFKITGKGDKYKDDKEDYKLESKVNLLNSADFKTSGTPDRNEKYRGIKYK